MTIPSSKAYKQADEAAAFAVIQKRTLAEVSEEVATEILARVGMVLFGGFLH